MCEYVQLNQHCQVKVHLWQRHHLIFLNNLTNLKETSSMILILIQLQQLNGKALHLKKKFINSATESHNGSSYNGQKCIWNCEFFFPGNEEDIGK